MVIYAGQVKTADEKDLDMEIRLQQYQQLKAQQLRLDLTIYYNDERR